METPPIPTTMYRILMREETYDEIDKRDRQTRALRSVTGDGQRQRQRERGRQRQREGAGRHLRTAPRNTTTRERESGWMRREETCIGDDEDRTTTEKERERDIYQSLPRDREKCGGGEGGGARPESETDAHTIKLDREQSMRRQTHTLRHTVHCTVLYNQLQETETNVVPRNNNNNNNDEDDEDDWWTPIPAPHGTSHVRIHTCAACVHRRYTNCEHRGGGANSKAKPTTNRRLYTATITPHRTYTALCVLERYRGYKR